MQGRHVDLHRGGLCPPLCPLPPSPPRAHLVPSAPHGELSAGSWCTARPTGYRTATAARSSTSVSQQSDKSPSPRCRLTAAAVRLPRLLVLGRARAAGRGPCAGHHRPAEGAAAAAGCGWAARAVRGHGKAWRCGPLPHRVARGLAGACFWWSVACSVGIGKACLWGLADGGGGRVLQLDPGIARL